ncbi:reverse transcriptase domain-containing protein [Tanacetum coccineum]
MTTPRPTPFPATTPRAGVFALFVIISVSDNEITTLPVIPTPPSPDHTPALYGCPLDSSDDSSDEDLKIPSLPSPPSTAVPPPPEYIESVGDDIKTLRTKVGSLEQHDVETMSTMNQGMSLAEIEQIVAHRVTDAIETIAIYEAKTRVARDLINRAERQDDKCKFHHTGPYEAKCGNCKWVGHQVRDCRTLVSRAKPRPSVAKQKAEVTCYECGRIGHYKNGCLERKNQNQVNKQWKGKTCGDSSVMANNVNV